MTAIPILLYHSVSAEPASWIAPYSVPPSAFARHVDAMIQSGRTPMTVSDFTSAVRGQSVLPERPLIVTFDDGFADFTYAAEALNAQGICSTLYVTTGALQGSRSVGLNIPPAAMLSWSQLRDLDDFPVEIGAHTHTHPQLDIIPISAVDDEIRRSKDLLEDFLDRSVPSFAYPHGFHSARVRAAVVHAGYDSACAVGNSLSSSNDHPFSIARLTVRADTTPEQLTQWLAGCGAPIAPRRERWRTAAWRTYRRFRGTRSVRGVFVHTSGTPTRQASSPNRSQ
ncbi:MULTISPECIES: polysaccharide deacetylase family protein [Rhodococcus]|uniref:polysaccharide deacetylase family protein n=1 Tax=Rhodococcus TaxID=1827 RepID=UPI001556A760|nr:MULTISPECIES: polysaccharide deacetylase family protein [Rhodococcus]